jgi:hypothetical protein
MQTTVQTVEHDAAYYFNMGFRYILLGLLVFIATTYIPKEHGLEVKTRLIISVAVVVVFSCLGIFLSFLGWLRTSICKLTCNCDPSLQSS